MQKYDFIYVSSYNECDESLVQGMRDAFAALGKSFAVLGYTSRYVENLYRRAEVPFVNLRSPGPLPAADEQAFLALEAQLDTTLRAFVFPESRYYMTPRSKLMRRAVAIEKGFRELRGKVAVGCMIHKLGAELIRMLALREADRAGIPSVFFGTFPAHFKGRMFLHGQIWSERDKEGAPASNLNDEVPYPEFREMLTRIRDRKEVVAYPMTGTRGWSEAVGFVSSLMRNDEHEFLGDIVSRRLEMLRLRSRHFFANRLASRQLPREPFYFFPLHVFDDSQTTLRNPHYYDQFWLIEHISRVLPYGMKLVVKLHPGLDGAVPFDFLRRIRKLDNVVLLSGSVNAHDVIKRSEGVIVINSTVAFEALLHRKPVLVMGLWSFGRLGLTLHVDDPRELPNALLKLREQRPDGEAIDRMLYDLYGEMYRCSYNRLPIDYDAIAGSILSYVGEKS